METRLGKNNSVVVAFRILNTDKVRLDEASTRNNVSPGEFCRDAALFEIQLDEEKSVDAG